MKTPVSTQRRGEEGEGQKRGKAHLMNSIRRLAPTPVLSAIVMLSARISMIPRMSMLPSVMIKIENQPLCSCFPCNRARIRLTQLESASPFDVTSDIDHLPSHRGHQNLGNSLLGVVVARKDPDEFGVFGLCAKKSKVSLRA